MTIDGAIRRRRTLVFALTASVSCASCSYKDISLVRNGADVHLDTNKSVELDQRRSAAIANFNAMLGTEITKLNTPLTQAEAKSTLRVGYAYIDRQCNTYFNALMHIQRDKNALSSELAIIGTAVTSLLVLTGAGAATAGIAAAATGAAVATADNLGSALLFELDAGATHGLTMRAMAAYANADPAQPSTVKTYGDAFAVLSGYALQCTPPQIEALVKAAVERAQPGDKSGTDPQRKGIDATVSMVLERTKGLTRLPSLTVEEAQILYALFVVDNGAALSDSEAVAALKSRLEGANAALAGSVFSSDGGTVKIALTPDNQRQLTSGLATIGIVDQQFAGAAQSIYEEASGHEAMMVSPPPAAVPDAEPSDTRMVPSIGIIGYD
jgi:hypothetical protein